MAFNLFGGKRRITKGFFANSLGNKQTRGIYTFQIDVENGELKFKIHIEDWLSNTYESGEYTLRRAEPTPKETEVQLLDWDYAEPSTNIKWVKTEKDVRIRTKVKNDEMFDSLLNIPPTGTK